MQDHRHARLVINKAEERAGRRGRWYLPNKQGVLTVCMGDLADATIVIGILAQVFFLEYYGLGRYLNWVITGMICVRALFSGWKYSGRALLLGLITVAGWLSGALLGGNMETFRANILLLLYPFVYTLYFFLLVTNKRDFLLGLFDAGFPVFNAILLLNMAIMFIQYSTHGMIAATTNDISYFEDNISGLFSYASVHAVPFTLHSSCSTTSSGLGGFGVLSGHPLPSLTTSALSSCPSILRHSTIIRRSS